MKQLALGVRLRTGAIFDSFVPGNNLEVLTALRSPATGANPLWLWGGKYSGKTHLLQALCSETGAAAGYFPLDRSLGLPSAALQGFANCPLLCIDDVDAVTGDLPWEEALFRLFNEAVELQTRLVFAAQAPPRQLDWVLDDWRSRAGACVVYQLHELDDAGRIDALRRRALQRGLELPPETAEYVLKRTPRDLPSLFELLDQLDEASLVAQRRLTIPFIRDALEKNVRTKP